MTGAVLTLLALCLVLLVSLVVVGLLCLSQLRLMNNLLSKDSTEAYLQAVRTQRTFIPKREKVEERGRKVEDNPYQRLEEMNPDEAYQAIKNYAEVGNGKSA